jgi:hypothetical protein
MQQHALELLRRLLHAGLRILPEPGAQITGNSRVEDQARSTEISGFHDKWTLAVSRRHRLR